MKKKNVLMTIVGIIIVILAAFFIIDNLDSLTASGQRFEKNGITFQYPDSWSEANSVAEGSVGAVANTENPGISVVIQQAPAAYGNDIQNACAYNDQFLAADGNYINIEEKNSSIHNNSVVMHRYIINEPDGSQKEHVATWIKMNDSKIYVILFSTPVDQYEQQRGNYDLVAGTFKLISDKERNSIFNTIGSKINQFLNN
ncbi:PsbP-related protein [Methanosphaera cuniculi]|uniref:PsbP C-terminal domain-containing protein n=2 Tax=Methanosphaera cuniculi TaxID=1077256 RepID=A0A2V2BSC5_9EURY|nr:hypothetical protein [Methanosphaera cuniculi]PWL08328.1 hypothetical protein MSCUN_07640 [Methanosphaera cuniculi]